MEREHLPKNLTALSAAQAPASKPADQHAAIGAVSQSTAPPSAQSIKDISPDLIDAGGLDDRLELSEADHTALVASIRTYGQQVPVLVRPHPEDPDRYQIVYGRRRVLALRELGQDVKAMVRDLDDQQAILAQGQENTARRDLSFIEKVNFARQMRDAGYDRKITCAALNVDKTAISRMLAIADRVPIDVIHTIGAAPYVGRDRWGALARAIVTRDWDIGAMIAFATGDSSDQRFQALMEALTRPSRRAAEAARAARPAPVALTTDKGCKLGQARLTDKGATLSFSARDAAGFDRWLVGNIDKIHREWIDAHGGQEDA